MLVKFFHLMVNTIALFMEISSNDCFVINLNKTVHCYSYKL